MSDLIRREDAIKAIEELPNAYNGWSDAYDKAYIIGALEEVPSADRPSAVDLSSVYSTAYKRGYENGLADRPQAEWIFHYRDKWMVKAECPKCHRRFEFSSRAMWKCCPMCETRMKGVSNEADSDKSK